MLDSLAQLREGRGFGHCRQNESVRLKLCPASQNAPIAAPRFGRFPIRPSQEDIARWLAIKQGNENAPTRSTSINKPSRASF